MAGKKVVVAGATGLVGNAALDTSACPIAVRL